ncbi:MULTISPECIES: ABC transporter permease [unclassified Clostridium]|uniref:ABC transporter permease n=1 Tax=unclassified Clostridium TaxID=2614128 RepID=UPI000ED366C0|nr:MULTISPECIES: ABC transporter permease [unclassified Clostridium]HCQ89716.1 bacitracin ABC transporter permease [Clostridium sp.]
MVSLIELELKRFNLKSHVFSVIIANIVILFLSVFMTYMLSIGQIPQTNLPSFELDTISISSMLIKATFLVWEAVLIARIIVEEFRSKTMSLLFTYPINRKKLIATKLMLILLVTFVSIVLSEFFQNICIFGVSKVLNFVSYGIAPKDVFNLGITTITATLLGMLPLYIGMIQKSTIATIISSLFIVSIVVNTQAGTGGLISIIPISLVLGAVGLFFAAIAIKNIVNNDLY